MKNNTTRLLIALVLVLMLSVWPVSGWFVNISPPWILLFVMYIQIFFPRLFLITWVFLLGLYCDVLFVSVIGEHVLALLLPCWILSLVSKRFIFLSILHQLLGIFICCMLYQIVIYGVDIFVGNAHLFLWSWFSAILGMLFWPWFRLCMDSESLKIN